MMWGGGPGPWWPMSIVGVVVVVAIAGLMVRMFLAGPPRGRLRHFGRPPIASWPGDTPAVGPNTAPGNIRVSNAERDEVIAQLRRHAGEGRLTLDEFEARVGEATEAKTMSELQVVLRDLPVLRAPTRRRR